MGFGNNPAPVKLRGRCCHKCNHGVVVPLRLSIAFKNMVKNKI